MDLDGISVFRKFLYLHKNQLESSGVPPHFWEILSKKLTQQIFDAGDAFSIYLIDYDEDERKTEEPIWTVGVTKPGGISCTDPNEIYLIDHTWSFRMDMARNQLEQVPQLQDRMSKMMGIDSDAPNCIQSIMESMWKYVQMYTIGGEQISVENQMPVWYVMDELGSAINHSDAPNFRIVPFLHLPDQVTYSVLFPIENVDEGTLVTRDFVENVPKNSLIRNALLLPWRYSSFTEINYEQDEPDAEYFREGRIAESLPEESENENVNAPLKVFTEYSLIAQYLTDSDLFQLVDNEADADILWVTHHFKDYHQFSLENGHKFINQFPFENVLTVKDLLSIVCRRVSSGQTIDADSLESQPKWLPTTFNLNTELLKFVSYYQHREQRNLDNHWIVKPWNLARGLDTYITKDLGQIMRLQPTGPKIVQKYIENPILFYRQDIDCKVKFDIRYVILLKSVHPLRAYIYKNFFLRFANKSFELNRLDDYQQHFTVMNYTEEFPLRHLPCAEFLIEWQKQYPNLPWQTIEQDICGMLKEMFVGATMKEPPCGIGYSRQSRAYYAADIMLEWQTDNIVQPKLLEVNWIPDCKRACEYYPDFFNDIFKLLFLNQENENVFEKFTD